MLVIPVNTRERKKKKKPEKMYNKQADSIGLLTLSTAKRVDLARGSNSISQQ